ncbi:MAG TPA: prepilin-type N-terminal cleavage/methylation domain-containing protein [Gemmatimonadaceae bacterium]
MDSRRSTSARRGFTLIEVLISAILMLVILAVTVQTFRRSSDLLAGQAGSLEAAANARFGITSLDHDLRVAGIGTVAAQPILVQASNTAITFNVDLVSRLTDDPFAVYLDPSADSAGTSAMRTSNTITLPNSTFVYPESTYYQASGILGGAETISYYLAKDSTTAVSTEYILWKRVNNMTPTVVARGIQYAAGDTVFQYFRVMPADTLAPVPMTTLPLYHNAAAHGSPADTGAYALIDSIRSVRITLNAVYHDPRAGDVLRPLQTTIRMLNAGLVSRTSCGQVPGSVTPSAVTSLTGATSPFVKLTWSASGDDGAGENDVYRYVIYRRPDTAAVFTQPYSSVAAGASSYTYTDNAVAHNDHWVYGVAAQDCTPSTSSVGSTGTIIVP